MQECEECYRIRFFCFASVQILIAMLVLATTIKRGLLFSAFNRYASGMRASRSAVAPTPLALGLNSSTENSQS